MNLEQRMWIYFETSALSHPKLVNLENNKVFLVLYEDDYLCVALCELGSEESVVEIVSFFNDDEGVTNLQDFFDRFAKTLNATSVPVLIEKPLPPRKCNCGNSSCKCSG